MCYLLGLVKAINQRLSELDRILKVILFHLGTSLWLRTPNQQDFSQCHEPNSDKQLLEGRLAAAYELRSGDGWWMRRYLNPSVTFKEFFDPSSHPLVKWRQSWLHAFLLLKTRLWARIWSHEVFSLGRLCSVPSCFSNWLNAYSYIHSFNTSFVEY